MSKVCILTDSTAQFMAGVYPGMDHVYILPWWLRRNGQPPEYAHRIALEIQPLSLINNQRLLITPPSVEDCAQTLSTLGRQYHDVVVVVSSARLSHVFQHVQKALQMVRCPAVIHLVDSQNISAGLGLLVQAAAQLIVQDEDGSSICRKIRGLVPHTYSLFCVQSLTYLAQGGHLDMAQALVGEMLDMMPFFILENGRLSPVQKARSSRQLMETVHEFVGEFERLEHIAVVHGAAPFDQEARSLRERLENSIGDVQISDQLLNAAVATIFGPRCLGVSVIEKLDG